MKIATPLVASAMFALATATLAQVPAERSGEQIVKAQCAACHEKGLHGAPRIDDRAAWVPRLKNGLDATVRSAIHGHGKMPARGGMADLTDHEFRSAVLYLFNPTGTTLKAPPAPVPPGHNQKIVDGIEVYLGVTQKGDGPHHVNITLRDRTTHEPIADAEVVVKVTNPVMGSETKKLVLTGVGEMPSYGNDFRISGKEPHVITVQIRRSQPPKVIEVRFDYRS